MINPLSFLVDFFMLALSWIPPVPLAVLGVVIVVLVALAIWRCIQ